MLKDFWVPWSPAPKPCAWTIRTPFTLIQSLLLFLLVLASTNHPSKAAQGDWQSGKGAHVEGRLISSVAATGELKTIPAGLELKIMPGWKTYWRSPGDAGLPPRFDWTGSSNLKSANISFPAPKRFELFGLQTFGYDNIVVLPLDLNVEAPGQAVDLKAVVEVLVCEKICVPQTLNLAMQIPAGASTPDTETAQTINRYKSRVPLRDAAQDLRLLSVKEFVEDDKRRLQINIASSSQLDQPDALIELSPYVAFGVPSVSITDNRQQATLTLSTVDQLPVGQQLSGREALITLIDGERAYEQKRTITTGEASRSSTQFLQQLRIIAFAIIGGFILNFMPCVLPVLSIKLMSFAAHRNTAPQRVRLSFLATAAGVIFSMLCIAGALIALKVSGQTVGWGIQFQQPAFIVALATIVTLFACNLWGLFEIVLPSRIANWVGQAGDGQGVAGEFSAGAFATLLATPCSAPFIGTAVGFALASGSAQILLIFACLGIGLALPYLAVAAAPNLVKVMPRPGPWMDIFRKVLSLALFATAIWLLFVLSGQVALPTLLFITAAICLIVLTLHITKVSRHRLSGSAAALLIAIFGLGAMGLTFIGSAKNNLTMIGLADGTSIKWQPFDQKEIRNLVAQGKTVFVDITADWCITCKANKTIAINTDRVSQRLKTDVIAMQGDWTRPNKEISEFLAKFGRFGIPFNIVYGPNQPRGAVLPELLTPDIVLSAIEEANLSASAEKKK